MIKRYKINQYAKELWEIIHNHLIVIRESKIMMSNIATQDDSYMEALYRCNMKENIVENIKQYITFRTENLKNSEKRITGKLAIVKYPDAFIEEIVGILNKMRGEL